MMAILSITKTFFKQFMVRTQNVTLSATMKLMLLDIGYGMIHSMITMEIHYIDF